MAHNFELQNVQCSWKLTCNVASVHETTARADQLYPEEITREISKLMTGEIPGRIPLGIIKGILGEITKGIPTTGIHIGIAGGIPKGISC